jgi:hypothetical protein
MRLLAGWISCVTAITSGRVPSGRVSPFQRRAHHVNGAEGMQVDHVHPAPQHRHGAFDGVGDVVQLSDPGNTLCPRSFIWRTISGPSA